MYHLVIIAIFSIGVVALISNITYVPMNKIFLPQVNSDYLWILIFAV